jgi:hypothetical protein
MNYNIGLSPIQSVFRPSLFYKIAIWSIWPVMKYAEFDNKGMTA